MYESTLLHCNNKLLKLLDACFFVNGLTLLLCAACGGRRENTSAKWLPEKKYREIKCLQDLQKRSNEALLSVELFHEAGDHQHYCLPGWWFIAQFFQACKATQNDIDFLAKIIARCDRICRGAHASLLSRFARALRHAVVCPVVFFNGHNLIKRDLIKSYLLQSMYVLSNNNIIIIMFIKIL